MSSPPTPFDDAGVGLWRAQNLSALDGVGHGFTNRLGGVSAGPLASLNLAVRGDDTAAAVAENWRRAVCAVWPDADAARLSVLNQVHGNRVQVDPQAGGPLHPVADADALVSTRVGEVIAVRIADCVPVLLACAGGVAAAHAGWRGAAQGVINATLRALLDATGASAGAVTAAIGPSICGHHYEVGDEVVAGLVGEGTPADRFVVGRSARGRALVDVAAAVADQLRRLGVSDVEQVSRCTAEDPLLWSHRRHGASGGRQAALIVRTA